MTAKRVIGLRAVLALVLALALGSGIVAASSHGTTTDFEGFNLGTVNGQEGWTVEDEWGFGRTDINQPAFDEEVTDDNGNRVWRVSNAVTTGGFSDHPYSPTSPLVAGETGANLYNDRGPDHTNPAVPPGGEDAETDLFHTGFSFKSVTGDAQPGLSMSIVPSAKQSSWRMSFLGVVDTGSGFDLTFYETDSVGGFPLTTVATGLSYDDWHTVDLYIEFVDGLNGDGSGNDIVHVVVNGSLVHTGTTWETYYALFPASGISVPRIQAVDAVLFNLRGTAAPANAGFGLYFDDVTVDNAALVVGPPSPETRNDCMKGGWQDFGFKNQGQCIQFVNTGKDSR
jgi:hypothetical protein